MIFKAILYIRKKYSYTFLLHDDFLENEHKMGKIKNLTKIIFLLIDELRTFWMKSLGEMNIKEIRKKLFAPYKGMFYH